MPHKILIVEDDNATRAGLVALLSDAGYEAIAVGNLRTAMQALSDEHPDLLIADVRLDGYNGLQLVAMGPVPIPAIMVTGYPDAMLEAEARQMGAEYLVKPISPPALIALITKKLAAQSEHVYTPARRWIRKGLSRDLPAQVEHSPARILDISYGGVRLEVDRASGTWPQLSFRLRLPSSDVSVPMDVVWKRQSGDTTWVCGAAVNDEDQPTWRTLVDAIA